MVRIARDIAIELVFGLIVILAVLGTAKLTEIRFQRFMSRDNPYVLDRKMWLEQQKTIIEAINQHGKILEEMRDLHPRGTDPVPPIQMPENPPSIIQEEAKP